MKSVEHITGMGGWRIKKNDREGEFNSDIW
jgi:hypothetical protein